ncbi:hypothetical protein [Poseidonibacter ostreae]|uniref:Uncharacterized protein n=1 Tax=Poseidonibacter ostreae TaxID=2654171 RepID=A0A6L4WSU2_9BACT|nr:hypothetical protein [Poseidonibacter ostreae]KAB7885005.1 hypothetical protein GA417_09770 [Poseidonibacter ostreae]KAB7888997.1 hypothetical protein GBG19_07350 [Poseidonibacter ostreae]KAB7891930.1 hypothetical protein GBG18_04900 [Poseidonibacter ostreae]
MSPNNKIQNNKPKKISQEERNQNLLELGGRDARVIIANTTETKTLLSKFFKLDAISKKSREQVGNQLDIEKFSELSKKFEEANKIIDEIIKIGTEENLYFDPRTKKFSYHEAAITKSLQEGKLAKEIAIEIKIPEEKVTSWIKLINSKNEEIEPKKSEAVKKTTKKDDVKAS